MSKHDRPPVRGVVQKCLKGFESWQKIYQEGKDSVDYNFHVVVVESIRIGNNIKMQRSCKTSLQQSALEE